MSTIYIIYEPQNIEGGGRDSVIKGVYFTLEKAKQIAQDLADLDTFKRWLEYPTVCYKTVFHIMEVPVGVPMNQELDYIDYVEATCQHSLIQNDTQFKEYKKSFDQCQYSLANYY
jgi:hypothetical protein